VREICGGVGFSPEGLAFPAYIHNATTGRPMMFVRYPEPPPVAGPVPDVVDFAVIELENAVRRDAPAGCLFYHRESFALFGGSNSWRKRSRQRDITDEKVEKFLDFRNIPDFAVPTYFADMNGDRKIDLVTVDFELPSESVVNYTFSDKLQLAN
jgi:hypothetical protein